LFENPPFGTVFSVSGWPVQDAAIMSQAFHVVLGECTEDLICWLWPQHLRRAIRCVRGDVDDDQKPVSMTRHD
jgi:hypothetical protein